MLAQIFSILVIDGYFKVLNIMHRILNEQIKQSLNHIDLALKMGNEV